MRNTHWLSDLHQWALRRALWFIWGRDSALFWESGPMATLEEENQFPMIG